MTRTGKGKGAAGQPRKGPGAKPGGHQTKARLRRAQRKGFNPTRMETFRGLIIRELQGQPLTGEQRQNLARNTSIPWVWVNSVEAFGRYRSPRQTIHSSLATEQRLVNVSQRSSAQQRELERAQEILSSYRLPGVTFFRKVSRGHRTILLCLVTGGTTPLQLKREITRHLIEDWEGQDYALYHDQLEIALGRTKKK